MTRPLLRIRAGTVATASLMAAVPAAQAATHAQPDPDEPITCVRCGVLTQSQLPGWVVNRRSSSSRSARSPVLSDHGSPPAPRSGRGRRNTTSDLGWTNRDHVDKAP
ncbi:hypothetical protein OJ998_10850 [Solirubrobacter taibaiensis]|nr:hypothetical protein [Solirubrobacter taibaiensis]